MNQPLSVSIAVIGSGYTSATLLAHLLDMVPDKADRVAVFGPSSLGRGAAFGTTHPDFRLNVRARIMQFRPAKPEAFPLWADQYLDDSKAHCDAGDFYRRADFARYVSSEVSHLPFIDEVRFVQQTVQSVRYDHNALLWYLSTDKNEHYTAAILILATGNPEPDWPCLIDDACHNRPGRQMICSPWSGRWLYDCAPDKDIMLIGGGLTAMDAIYALGQAEHKGRVQLVTPMGILPPAQTNWGPVDAIYWPDDLSSASEIVRFMARHLKQGHHCPWTDPVWQSRFEALRVNLNPVWRRLPAAEKRRLMVRLGASWSLVRYRSAPQTSRMANQMKKSGQLTIHTGRVARISIGKSADRLSADLYSGQRLDTDIIVNCTGMGRDRLLADMVAGKIIKADAFGRGPQLADQLHLCSGNGHPYPAGFALGAMTAGSEGDVVGATSISRQAARLVSHLMDIPALNLPGQHG